MLKEVRRQVDYFAEAVALLEHIAANKSYKELKHSLCKKRNITFESKSYVFDTLIKIEKAAYRFFETDKEQLEYYFVSEEGLSGNAGKALLLWDYFDSIPYQNIADIKKHIEELSEEQYTKEFGKVLQDYIDTLHDESDSILIETPLDIIRYLMNMEISQEEKWKLQMVFLNRKEHLVKVTELIKKAEVFLQGYENELQIMVEDFYQYWSRVLSESTYRDFFIKRVAIDLPENPLGYRIRPSILLPNTLGIHVDIEDDGTFGRADEGLVGILFGEELDLFYGREADKKAEPAMQVLPVLKLLSDRSKFEILSYISDKSAYGSELAKQMNLTTATISHHMSSMIAEGLVSIEKKENRIYYCLNKETMERVLNICRNVFLQE